MSCGLTHERQIQYLDEVLDQENVGGGSSSDKVSTKYITQKNVCQKS